MSAQGNTQDPATASQAETFMSTQDAKERAETRAAAKGKAKEVPAALASPAKPQSSMGPPAKPGQTPGTTNKPSAPAPPAPTTTTPASKSGTAVAAPNTPADVPSVTPQKRGPGRPRKSEKLEPIGPPVAKRPRGRPRNSNAPAANTRQRARDEAAEQSEDAEYQDSDESSTESIPPNVLVQYNAHVSILRTKLDSRGIPEQYSVSKSFWVPVWSSYFDGGATGPPGRFAYWDPLFITSVGCPVCHQPLAIAAGGGWLDEPLSMRDGDGPCWVIGRRYVCTQCFAATEVAARYVDHGDLDRHSDSDHPDPSNPASAKESKPKSVDVDFSSPVYYISWEKRFRDLLPPALAAEFPTRVKKRGAKEKEVEKDRDKEDEEDGDDDGEGEAGADETPKRSTKRMRHCMKCGSKMCQGRMGRSRCPNACYDCGSTTCNGRPKPNLTCKGEITKTFKELTTEESSSPVTEASMASAAPPAPAPEPSQAPDSVPAAPLVTDPAPPPPDLAPAPAPQPNSWPAGLPEVPPGFVLAIPYAIGADGKPSGTGPGMAYLVPKGDVPGFLPAPAQVPAPAGKPDVAKSTTPTETSGSTEPIVAPPTPAPAPAADAPQAPQLASKKNSSRAKPTPQKVYPQPHSVSLAPAPAPTPSHPHPYPPPPGVSYHPHPPHSHPHPGGPEPGYYGGYYPPYGYPSPYGFGFYAPYPPQSHPENGAPQQPHPPPPQSPYYPSQSGYAPPPPGYGAPGHPPPGPYGPAPGPAPPHDTSGHPPANGYAPPGPASATGAFHRQPQQYIAYQPHVQVASAATGPATKKRKTAATPAGTAAAEGDKAA